MNLFRRHPRARWAVPAAAAALVAGGVGLTSVAASAAPLPETTAADLLVRLHDAGGTPLSGTVAWSADFGLPDLAAMGLSMGRTDLTTLLAGDSTLRVWTDGAESARLDLLADNAERSVTRTATDVWAWDSEDGTATHLRLPTEADRAAARDEALAAHGLTGLTDLTDAQREAAAATLRQCLADAGLEPPAGHDAEDGAGHPAAEMPATVQEAAEAALAHIDGSTEVTVEGQTRVAGRAAYELVFDPRDEGTRIAEIRLAVDGETGAPLRVQVVSTVTGAAAVEVGFTDVSFAAPDAGVFAFTPARGTEVEEIDPADLPGHGAQADPAPEGGAPAHPDVAPPLTLDPATGTVTCDPAALRAAHDAHEAGLAEGATDPTDPTGPAGTPAEAPELIGDGWDAVVVGRLPEGALDAVRGEPIAPADLAGAAGDREAAERVREQAGATTSQVGAVLDALPRVTGPFGSARVLDGPLLSVVVTDDGRVAAGAVDPQRLLDALS